MLGFRLRKQHKRYVLCFLTILVFSISIAVCLHQYYMRQHLALLTGGNRQLLTFRSTANWGIGNAMFAFASTYASSLRSAADKMWIVCFDGNLPLRSAFGPLMDWPQCKPVDVIAFMDPHVFNESSFAK